VKVSGLKIPALMGKAAKTTNATTKARRAKDSMNLAP
jgi:hypothetical protein